MTDTTSTTDTGTNARLILLLRVLLGAVIIGLLGFSFIIGYESGAKNETAQAHGISFSPSDGSQWTCFRPATADIRSAFKGQHSVYDPNSGQICFRTSTGDTSFGTSTSGSSGGTLTQGYTTHNSGGSLKQTVEIGTAVFGSAGGASLN